MSSPLILPTQLPSASSWGLADFRELTLTSPPAGGGVAIASGPQLDSGELWLIDHMVSSCTSTAATTLRIYDTTVGPGYLLDGTDRGNFDVADWPTGLQVQPSRQLVAAWSGASDAARGTLRFQFRVMRRSGG